MARLLSSILFFHILHLVTSTFICPRQCQYHSRTNVYYVQPAMNGNQPEECSATRCSNHQHHCIPLLNSDDRSSVNRYGCCQPVAGNWKCHKQVQNMVYHESPMSIGCLSNSPQCLYSNHHCMEIYDDVASVYMTTTGCCRQKSQKDDHPREWHISHYELPGCTMNVGA